MLIHTAKLLRQKSILLKISITKKAFLKQKFKKASVFALNYKIFYKKSQNSI